MRKYRKRAAYERFWAKVKRAEVGCWEWLGTRLDTGYGCFSVGSGPGNRHRAHRYSWELHYGPIPDGLQVIHHCDNRACVRPEHLFLGDHNMNMQDAVRKDRWAARKEQWATDRHEEFERALANYRASRGIPA